MGIFWGKKKKEAGIIRKTSAGSRPKATSKSKAKPKSDEETSISSRRVSNGTQSEAQNGVATRTNEVKLNDQISGTRAKSGSVGGGLEYTKGEVMQSSRNNSKPGPGFASGLEPGFSKMKQADVSPSVINLGGKAIPVIGDEEKKFDTKPISELVTLERVVNIYGISSALFKNTRALLTAQEWNDPSFIQLMESVSEELDKELSVIKNFDRLRDWVYPLHYRKTGSVLGAGRVMASNYRYYTTSLDKLKQTGGVDFGYSEQRQLRECLKELLRTFLNFSICCELVVSSDFISEINELARTMRDVVDTASGKINFVFDDVARICTTCSIRLARLALWKSIQVTNVTWSRQVNDTCFTVAKATKVLYHIGLRLYENMVDQTAYQNLTALTKGVVVQIKKLQSMVQNEPTEQKSNTYSFTPEAVAEHLAVYDQGIKEVYASLNSFAKHSTKDKTIIDATNTIIEQVEAIKLRVTSPDTSAIVFAVANISESVEKFCGTIYYALHLVGEENEVIKEQIMETMQHAVHCIIQLQMVACARGLNFPIINTEAAMLNCLRSLLLSASIIIESVEHLRKNGLMTEEPSVDNALCREDINEAIVYILHYGRPLFRGDEGDWAEKEGHEEDMEEYEEPVITTKSEKKSSPPVSESTTRRESPSPSIGSSGTPTRRDSPAPSVVSSPAPAQNKEQDEALLAINPDDYNENNLPPGFEPAPPKPNYSPGSSEESYKHYMVAKYEYETWENKLVLYKIKLKKEIQEIKSRKS